MVASWTCSWSCSLTYSLVFCYATFRLVTENPYLELPIEKSQSEFSGNRPFDELYFRVKHVSVLSPAIGMTLYGPNWNGIYWEQNTTKGTDSLAAIIDSASPTATKTFKWIFIVSGEIFHFLKFFFRNFWIFSKI